MVTCAVSSSTLSTCSNECSRTDVSPTVPHDRHLPLHKPTLICRNTSTTFYSTSSRHLSILSISHLRHQSSLQNPAPYFEMAANTKYQAAPQRDSFDEPNYTQAPPSYQAEGSNHDNLLGAPRGEDDNVPDDFKVAHSIHTSRTRDD